jgi:hypothetical protein
MHTVKFNNFHIHGEVKFPFSTFCGVSSESLPKQLANNSDITKEGCKFIWSFTHLLHLLEGWIYKQEVRDFKV